MNHVSSNDAVESNGTIEAYNAPDISGINAILESVTTGKDIAPNPLERPLWQVDEDFIDPFTDLPEIQTWAKMGDRPALPKQGIITFASKQKRGKSLSIYALALALLSGKQFDTVTPIDKPRLIMIFDMEMSLPTIIKRIRPIVTSLGTDGARFVVCSLKAKSIEQRKQIILDKVKSYSPDIVVIDQAAKLVMDINSTVESESITSMLDQMSLDRGVWVVIHENKSAGDNNMRGHLGSYLSFANVEAYTVNKDKGIFTITYKEGRDTDADNAAKVNFAIDEQGNIIGAANILAAQRESKAEEFRKDLRQIFGDNDTLRHGEIMERIVQKQGLTRDGAKRKIDLATETGAIAKIGTEKKAPYRITESWHNL